MILTKNEISKLGWSSPKSGIYFILSLLNRKIYVGKTEHFVKRVSAHTKNLERGTHQNSYLQRAWNKYGKENFEFLLIEELDRTQLLEKEKFYICKLNTLAPNGFNLTKGGDGGAMTGEALKKIGLAHLGKPLSKEHKIKIGKALRGRIFTEEHLKNLSLSQKIKPNHIFTREDLEKAANLHAKKYKFLSPNRELVEIHNLSSFCRENNLNVSRMVQVNLKNAPHHRGWTKFYEQEKI